jgi:[lysine-biosynthesis-protein LysW]--L-2-aminoadipate ligase
VTNATGPETSLWRKDTVEYALRTLTRRSGIVVSRPYTFIASGENVPAAIEYFSQTHRTAIAKPAGNARGEGIVIVRPGDQVASSWPSRRHVVQDLVAAPLTIDGVKIDLRAYVLVRSDNRDASGLVGPILVRRASSAWHPGEEISELTNTALRHRLGLNADIVPLEDLRLDAPIETAIRSELRTLAATLIDAAQLWTSDEPRPVVQGGPLVQMWGIDALVVKNDGGTRLALLEVNIYPQLFRGAVRADRAVARLLADEYTAALDDAIHHGGDPLTRTRRSAGSRRRSDSAVATILTTRRNHETTRALTVACSRRGIQLLPSEQPVAGSRVVFHWGLDRPDARRILRHASEWCADNRAALVNGTLIDKWRQLVAMHETGVPVPRSWLAKSCAAAVAAAHDLGYPVILKPLWGSYGKGVRRAVSAEELAAGWRGPSVVQAWIPEGWQCTRVLVIDRSIVSAVTRSALDGRIATYDHGRRAHLSAATLDHRETRVAIDACEALGIAIGGVDVVPGPRGPLVLEVNHRGVELHLTPLHGDDAVDRVADFLADRAAAASA